LEDADAATAAPAASAVSACVRLNALVRVYEVLGGMSMSSRVRLVVVMDPIEAINPAKDSTLAILLAAQANGWQLFYAELGDIWLRDGIAWGRLAPLKVFDDPRTWFARETRIVAKLGEYDVILMRKDPPFDTEYIYSTYILERAREQGALVCNRPQGLRDMNEKVYTAWFPECCAPTLITRDMHDMSEFLREHGKAVCKPLHGMGGRSIFALEQGDKNRNVIFETLTDYGRRYAIIQRYLPEIVTGGDCRVILIDGEPVPFALQRMPDAADHRGNLAAGAHATSRPLNDRDRWLCSVIGPKLKAAGMIFVGLDVIGDFVTEINVTSPTGIRELDRKHGVDIGGMLVSAISRTLEAA
jgi:glutathione synthase